MESNCCFNPSITPPNESIFDALDDIASIVILMASSSAFRFELDDASSEILPNSCLRLSIICEPVSNFAVFPEPISKKSH